MLRHPHVARPPERLPEELAKAGITQSSDIAKGIVIGEGTPANYLVRKALLGMLERLNDPVANQELATLNDRHAHLKGRSDMRFRVHGRVLIDSDLLPEMTLRMDIVRSAISEILPIASSEAGRIIHRNRTRVRFFEFGTSEEEGGNALYLRRVEGSPTNAGLCNALAALEGADKYDGHTNRDDALVAWNRVVLPDGRRELLVPIFMRQDSMAGRRLIATPEYECRQIATLHHIADNMLSKLMEKLQADECKRLGLFRRHHATRQQKS